MKVVLQPCADTRAKKNFERSISHSTFSVELFTPFLNEEEIKDLLSIYHDHNCQLWGVKPNSFKQWKKLELGDVVLFNGGNKFYAIAQIVYKLQNPALANFVWGNDNRDDNTWENIYFITDVKVISIDYQTMRSVIGWDPNYIFRTFMVLNQIQSDHVIEYLLLQDESIMDFQYAKIEETLNQLEDETPMDKERIKALIQNLTLIEPPVNIKSYVENSDFKGSVNRNHIKENIQKNKNGRLVEEAIYEREKLRLKKENIDREVIWASKTKGYGDGCGYDILSYERLSDGTIRECYIEVKSTVQDETTPFDITDNEVKFSRKHPEQYYLYRVSKSKSDNPNYFVQKGSIEDLYRLESTSYKAYKKED